jgi:hypothetical protein
LNSPENPAVEFEIFTMALKVSFAAMQARAPSPSAPLARRAPVQHHNRPYDRFYPSSNGIKRAARRPDEVEVGDVLFVVFEGTSYKARVRAHTLYPHFYPDLLLLIDLI